MLSLKTLNGSLVIPLLFGSCGSLSGETVEWFSSPFASNLGNETSEGAPLDSSWFFHLGYFKLGFEPEATNTSMWSSQWVMLDITSYSESFQFFTAEWTEDGSVPDGTRAYIWGVNRNVAAQEWILLSDENWTFPLPPSGINPDGNEQWSVTSSTNSSVAILGSVNEAGLLMKSVSVENSEPALLEGNLWRELVFTESDLADVLISGWDADPDKDGISNLEEFAFGSDPKKGEALNFPQNITGGSLEFGLSIARNVAVDIMPQVSSDLFQWNEGTSFVVSVDPTPISLFFRDLTMVRDAPRRFGRVILRLRPNLGLPR